MCDYAAHVAVAVQEVSDCKPGDVWANMLPGGAAQLYTVAEVYPGPVSQSTGKAMVQVMVQKQGASGSGSYYQLEFDDGRIVSMDPGVTPTWYYCSVPPIIPPTPLHPPAPSPPSPLHPPKPSPLHPPGPSGGISGTYVVVLIGAVALGAIYVTGRL